MATDWFDELVEDGVDVDDALRLRLLLVTGRKQLPMVFWIIISPDTS